MSHWSMGRSQRGVWFWLENIKETLFTGAVSKLQKKLVHGEDLHPTLYAQRIKGIIIHLKKPVYINVYLHVNLTENKYN